MRSNIITFVLFMFNEEKRIERAVRNFLPYGRVLVVDNYSSDKTVEIAKALGADVLQHKNPGWVEDENTTSVVKEYVKTPWIYWGFSDEIVDAPTMEAMLEAIESDTCSIVNIARKNYYYGKFTHDAYQNMQSRAFIKEAIDFRGNKIHHFGKHAVPENKVITLDPQKYFVHHFISNTAKTYLSSLDRYTDIEATHTQTPSPIKMIFRMFRGFIGHYFLRGGYKAGRAGLYLGMQMAFYNVLLAMKSYEYENKLSTPEIEALNNKFRDQLLSDIYFLKK